MMPSSESVSGQGVMSKDLAATPGGPGAPGDPAEAAEAAEALLPRWRWLGILRWVLGLAVFLALVVLVVRALRPQLEAVGHAFVDHFGFAGMALGTSIADGFHFPLPAQFYMLLAVAAHSSALATLSWICAGSLFGGGCGYLVARRLARFPRFARWLERVGRRLRGQLDGRNAYRSAVILSLSPLAFSVQCYVCGFYRLAPKAFLLLLLIRIPKLLLFYQLVRFGWSVF
jgi:membrane protein YqaA with SNARE-associated domain